MITSSTQDSSMAQRFLRETTAEVLFDDFSRGLYSTDASIYQIKPLGVVVPKTEEDVLATLGIANDAGVSVTMRGGGTSQCGQTVGEGIIVDVSKHLNRLISVDPETRRAVVQPGIVLDQLNALLKPHGLFFPVDVSHQQPGDHWRHDGQQQLRGAIHPLRQDGGQCPGGGRGAGGWESNALW